MKIKEDYEYVGLRRFIHWINGDPMEDYIPGSHLKRENVLKEDEIEFQKNEVKQSFLTQSLQYLTDKAFGWYDQMYRVFACIVAIVMIGVLLMTVSYLPEYGNADNAVNNEVSERYIEQGLQETGAVNIVAGLILDYRAFDTLGEAHVLFIAAASVLILLRLDYDKNGKLKDKEGIQDEGYDRMYEPRNDSILRLMSRFLFPIMVLFGFYVILNGHLSAGGGFAGGAIIGSALILYANAFGFKSTRKFFTYKTFQWVSFCALISYACLKTYSFYCGANHLESGISLGTAGNILSAGLILPLNFCVGLVVACTMYTFFAMFRKGGL